MILKDLKLKNFRNINDVDIEFSNNFNIIYGKNGSGKTNLVESIYILALTKSFRTNKDDNLINNLEKDSNLFIEGTIQTKLDTKYKIMLNKSSKQLFIDNVLCSKVSDYISNINVILFNPEDVFLVNETPTERRRFINIELSKINKKYFQALAKYNKILKMRNSYLKIQKNKESISLNYLNVLTENLIKVGLEISDYRFQFIKDINLYLNEIYKKIFSYGNLEVRYESKYLNKTSKDILNDYNKVLDKEILYKKTLLGIHHDDFLFYLDDNLIKEYGSIGQQKNSILSFKLSEIEVLKKYELDKPILILDDLFSELDVDKIKNILSLLSNDLQIFITSTDKDKFNFIKDKDYKLFNVKEGKIVEEENGKQS